MEVVYSSQRPLFRPNMSIKTWNDGHRKPNRSFRIAMNTSAKILGTDITGRHLQYAWNMYRLRILHLMQQCNLLWIQWSLFHPLTTLKHRIWVSPEKIQNKTTRPHQKKKNVVYKRQWNGEAGVKYMIQKTYLFCLCCYCMTFLLVKTEECWCTILGLICHSYGTSLRHVNLTVVCRCLLFFSTIGLLKQLINQLLKIKKNVLSVHRNMCI
jgi:hypothetical protein